MEHQPASPIAFYAATLSGNSLRVRVYLKEKTLAYSEHTVNLPKGEQKTPEYLKINPRGQVPAITDGNVTMAESVAIIEYLESTYSGSGSLIPSSKADRATCYEKIAQFHQKLDGKSIFGRAVFAKKTKEDLKTEIDTLKEEIQAWDGYLEGRQWLANSFSIADITILPNILLCKIIGLNLANYKNLNNWFNAMMARDSVKNDPIINGWAQAASHFGFASGMPQVLSD